MSEIQTAWLELILVGGIGAAIALSGAIMNIVAKRQNKLCTKQTEGIVAQYRFMGEGRMYPIVEYFVDETCYRTRKKFRGILVKQISGLPVDVKSKAYEDEKGYLHIKIGSIVNMRQLAEQLWPIGSKMTVFYDPHVPKRCYVDRPIHRSAASAIFIIMGIFTMVLGLTVFFMIRL